MPVIYTPVNLAEQHEQLRLASQRLWRIVQQRNRLPDAELRDALDRLHDRLRTSTAGAIVDCQLCHRPMQVSARVCLYCGTNQIHALT